MSGERPEQLIGPPVSARLPLAVVIVTYGDRWELLERVLDAVLPSPVIDLVVLVDNGSDIDLRSRLATAISSGRLQIVGNGQNLGSAGGFTLGLETVRSSVSENAYALMLDDDNLPGEGALDAVARAVTSTAGRAAVMMNRQSMARLRALVEQGTPVRHDYDTFCGVSLRGLLRCTIGRRRPTGVPPEHPPLGFAPYGGLALPLAALDLVAPPRNDYYLYWDDLEFTTRLVATGFEIRLVPSATLHDLEESWSSRSRTFIAGVDLETPDARVYYTNRNRRHFERRHLERRVIERLANRCAFWCAVGIDAVASLLRGAPLVAVRCRVALIRQAIADGESGQLGQWDSKPIVGADGH